MTDDPKIKVCLECTLPICRPNEPVCPYIQITRAPSDRERVKAWYRANTDHKKAYVANWSKNNMAKKVAANKRYRDRLRERRASGR